MHTDKETAAAPGEPRVRPGAAKGPSPTAGATARPATNSKGNRYARGERVRRMETWISRGAVVLVVVSAVLAAVMSQRFDPAEPVLQQAEEAPDAAAGQKGVVQAPPLKPAPIVAQRAAKPGDARNAAAVLGAGPACRNCGVIEMVVAVHGYEQPEASGYQMHIRMDDGSVRTVEQRGALAAGSRVVVERDSVRVLPERAGQG